MTIAVLMVCFVYLICSSIIFLIHAVIIPPTSGGIPNENQVLAPNERAIEAVTKQVCNTVAMVNSSVNFLIYIVFNKYYRKTYIALFIPSCFKRSTS